MSAVWKCANVAFLASVLIAAPLSATKSLSQAPAKGPALLTYDDLVRLYEEPTPAAELQNKLDKLLTTPFLSNAASQRGVKPVKPNSPELGRFLRLAAWNIEEGLEFNAVRAALGNDKVFLQRLAKTLPTKEQGGVDTILQQADMLKQADIVVLNEVDWGLKRTDYRNVARELATALNMNYAFGVEFVEVDPLTLGTEQLEGETAPDKGELIKHMSVDKSRTLGLHGTAIISRYPLSNVRIARFANLGHDWYADEKKQVSKLESGKRKGSGLVFEDKILREVRRGGRMMLLADVEDREIPNGKLTIVATHLENKTKPVNRVKQLQEILAQIKDIDHTVVVAGDMNTTGSDLTPTSFQREVKKRMGSTSFWLTKGVKYATGVGLLYDITLGAAKFARTRSDHTVKSFRFVSENSEEKFFTTLKDFRFSDGGAFDFRGSREASIGGSSETLSDSNERGSKGFVDTLELKGKIDIPFKLDWFFVKPARFTDPDDRGQSFLFAPHFGRTLKALNHSLKDGISDHNPIIVDLPLSERTAGRL